MSAFGTWTYNGWTASGSVYPDGSMHDASVHDHNGLLCEYSMYFSSKQDFVNYVNRHY